MKAHEFSAVHQYQDPYEAASAYQDCYLDPEALQHLQDRESAADDAVEEVALHGLAEESSLHWRLDTGDFYNESWEQYADAHIPHTDFTDPESVAEFFEAMAADALLGISPDRIMNVVEEVAAGWERALTAGPNTP